VGHIQRIEISPRNSWRHTVIGQGLTYNCLPDGTDYWNESAYYSLTPSHVTILEKATNELQNMCLAAGQYIIDNARYSDFGIPGDATELIRSTWAKEPPALYGRMDLAYDGTDAPKLLEYNADTPTSLVEASVVQWFWLKDKFPSKDQFNSIHDKLVWKWKDLKAYMKPPVFFAHCDTEEDTMTTTYLRQTAEEAGIETRGMLVSQIGWDIRRQHFVGLENEEIQTIFKLYPWEMIVKEPFWKNVMQAYPKPIWIEPIWKMMFSNKALLAILWEMYPNNPYLLPAYLENRFTNGESYVIKPKLGREGANVVIIGSQGEPLAATDGPYADSGLVYQKYSPATQYGEKTTILGSWLVADAGACGVGFRESDALITGNFSRFVPHVIE
jgi:glutathionylspermidine synthase